MSRALLVLEGPGNGGTEVYVAGLADFLAPTVAVEIVLLSGSRSDGEALFPGHAVRAVDGIRGLAALLRAGATVVNMHLYSSLLPAVRAARAAGVTVVTTLHMPLAPWHVLHRLRWRLAAALSHTCVGVSTECFSGYGPLVPRAARLVAPGPLPLADMPPASLAGVSAIDNFTAVYAGRLSREKDLPTLIGAIAACPGMGLVLIGEGPDRSELEALSARLGVAAEFTGRLPRKAVFDRLGKADAFVLPSRFEGLGISAIEAMALGVPTITANFPASAEYIVPGKTGLTFPIGDAPALARQLAKLRDDDALRRALSQAGAAHVRANFTPEAQYGKYARLFAAITAAQDQIRLRGREAPAPLQR